MKAKESKKIIGLTGTYCAGKNYIALLLERRGIPVLDVDKLGHQVIELEKDRLKARFGCDILHEKGHVDRRRLGAKVFGKPGELAALEDIIHPGANRITLEWVQRQEKACAINAALLHRTAVFETLDAIIFVKAPFLVRLLRARKRDGLPWTVLLKRFASQRDFTAKYFSGNADTYTVENSCFSTHAPSDSRDVLENQINEILSRMGIG